MSEETESIEIACPHCGQVLVADSSFAGGEVECPTCNNTFTAPTVGAWTDGEEKAGTECVPEHDSETTQESESAPDESEPADSVPRASFSNRAKGVAERSMKRGVHFLSRFAGRFGGLAKRIGPRRMAIAATVVVLAAGLSFSGRSGGIRISSEQIIRGKRDCNLVENGKGFRTNGRRMLSFELPLELRSKRLTFDIRFHEDPEQISDCVQIKTGSYLMAPAVKVQSKGKRLKTERWIPVDIRLGNTMAVIRIGGKKESMEIPVSVGFHTLLFGHGVDYSVRNVRSYPTKNHRKAVKIYEAAIELKGTEQWKKKLAMFKKAAQLGLSEAQEAYALFGSAGFGGASISNKEMVEWTRKAAEQGSTDAQWGLGNFYYDGRKVPKDEREALKWLRLAAEGGKPGAMLNLGILLMRGKVVDKDAREAQNILSLCRILVENGEADDLDNEDKGYLYLLLSETYILGGQGAEIDKSLGRKWLNEAAEYGNSDAIEILRNAR